MIKHKPFFENCFRVLDGPDAPDIVGQELDRELILTLVNPPSSNNFNETYEELDPFIVEQIQTSDITFTLDTGSGNFIADTILTTIVNDRMFRFQGYQIWQVKDASVGPSDLGNPDMARLVGQCDIKDGVTQLVNYEFDSELNASRPIEEVNGADEGIQRTFRVQTDLFAIGNPRLINHKTYHYMALAYAYNNYADYDPANPATQDKPYKGSRQSATGAIRAFSFNSTHSYA